MRTTAALLSAFLVLGSAGAALASPVDPQQDITDGIAMLDQLPFGSDARAQADNLLTEAQQAMNHRSHHHGEANTYQAYNLARQAIQIEQQALNNMNNKGN